MRRKREEQQPCHAGRELLTQIKLVREPENNHFVPDNGEIADPAPCNGGGRRTGW